VDGHLLAPGRISLRVLLSLGTWRDTNFDLCYARQPHRTWAEAFGGKTDKTGEECLREWTGAIAAFLLGQATGAGAYYTMATKRFRGSAPFVDSIPAVLTISKHQWAGGRFAVTYNQGTLLARKTCSGYTKRGRLAAAFTMNETVQKMAHYLCRRGAAMVAVSTGFVGDGSRAL